MQPRRLKLPSNMESKALLRRELTAKRAQLSRKAQRSRAIGEALFATAFYRRASLVLCYVSLEDEVDTYPVIRRALADGKAVAVPYCTDRRGHMLFYRITSLNDLHTGSFGVKEPDITRCEEVTGFDDSIVLVPGLSFDRCGNRLGYGKGYFDRFLKNYPFISVGLCYNSLIKKELPTDAYDRQVDYIITETGITDVKRGGNHGSDKPQKQ